MSSDVTDYISSGVAIISCVATVIACIAAKRSAETADRAQRSVDMANRLSHLSALFQLTFECRYLHERATEVIGSFAQMWRHKHGLGQMPDSQLNDVLTELQTDLQGVKDVFEKVKPWLPREMIEALPDDDIVRVRGLLTDAESKLRGSLHKIEMYRTSLELQLIQARGQ